MWRIEQRACFSEIPKSPRFHQKSPVFYQKNHVICRKSPIFYFLHPKDSDIGIVCGELSRELAFQKFQKALYSTKRALHSPKKSHVFCRKSPIFYL